MNSTNGSKVQSSRDQIIREATYFATLYGYYDTSEAAQQANLVENQRVERELREMVLDVALRYFTGEGSAAWMVDGGPGERDHIIEELLGKGDKEERAEGDSMRHPVVMDLLPGMQARPLD
jgi:hypothetical protein